MKLEVITRNIKAHGFRAFLSTSVLSTRLTFTNDIFIILFYGEEAFSTLNIRTSLARCPNFGH